MNLYKFESMKMHECTHHRNSTFDISVDVCDCQCDKKKFHVTIQSMLYDVAVIGDDTHT